MRIKRVLKKITTTKQSIEEIRRENHPYFITLAKKIGEAAAREAEEHYLAEIAQELQTVTEGQAIEVPMVQIIMDDEDEEARPS